RPERCAGHGVGAGVTGGARTPLAAWKRLGVRLTALRKAAINPLLGRIAVWLLKVTRHTDPDRFADVSAAMMRRIGPFLPEHRLGRANLAAAFPDKSAAEIGQILRGVWDNLGRVAAEYPHLDRLWDLDPERPTSGRIVVSQESIDRFMAL